MYVKGPISDVYVDFVPMIQILKQNAYSDPFCRIQQI
jgi:hypothetical protein